MIIYLEDLVANAIIELWQNKGIKKVSDSTIVEYKKEILKRIEEKGLNLRFNLSSNFCMNDYFFTFEDAEGILYLVKDGVSLNNLYEKFRGIISVEALLVLIDADILKSIGIEKKK